jgi:predicted unusual protein kinase regulating ubiquinone biosynthesis (AarF/ABC1/UbiB family)
MRSLQQSAPPMDFTLVRGVLEEELGDLARHFKHVEEEPIASASIGQVHRARLLDGTRVVLKVQYPGVDRAIESDLAMTQGISAMVGTFFRNLDAASVVAELKDRVREELDYRRELENQALFGRIWQGHPLIRVPAVFPAHSSKRVLCQEYARGLSFYDFLEQSTERERRLAVYVLHDFVFDSMFMHRVFNGDPHPGNYLFQEDGGITFLDFGCVKRFPTHFVRELQGLSRAIAEDDRERFDELAQSMKVVLPGRPYDRDLLWDFFGYHGEPFARDEHFTFTSEWIAKARAVMDQKTLAQINLPPDLLFFNRITFGLNAIFHKLGASDNFHRLYRRYMYEEEAHPPALAKAGVELPERFLHIRGPEHAEGVDAAP